MDITEAQYEPIAPVFPVQLGNIKPSNLDVLNAILYVAEHRCKWRGLLARFGVKRQGRAVRPPGPIAPPDAKAEYGTAKPTPFLAAPTWLFGCVIWWPLRLRPALL